MEWTADVASGDWLRERIDDPWRGTMHDFVPRGFAAYARVFHPATRERPVDRAWPDDGDQHAWELFLAAQPQVDTERVTWEQTARAFGTVMHPLAQWGRLVRDTEHGDGSAPRDAAQWRYDRPDEGQLEPDTLSALAHVLSMHTATPDAGRIAVWDGWGNIVGGMGSGPARTFLRMGFAGGMPERYSDEPVDDAELRHASFLARSLKDVFNNPFRQQTWQPGILSDDISRGPRLKLPGRDHVLFSGGAAELADPTWVLDAPWRDRVAEEYGAPPAAQAPSILWPDDRAWVMVTEVDVDSTIVAGTPDLVRAMLRESALEVAQIREGADLSWDADDVNR